MLSEVHASFHGGSAALVAMMGEPTAEASATTGSDRSGLIGDSAVAGGDEGMVDNDSIAAAAAPPEEQWWSFTKPPPPPPGGGTDS